MYSYDDSWIKTHGSESWSQEEAGCMRRTSELFTGITAVKLAINALISCYESYRIVINNSTCSNDI